MYPVNTQRHNNVVTTSLQRRDVAATLKRRCDDVVYLLGRLIAVSSRGSLQNKDDLSIHLFMRHTPTIEYSVPGFSQHAIK